MNRTGKSQLRGETAARSDATLRIIGRRSIHTDRYRPLTLSVLVAAIVFLLFLGVGLSTAVADSPDVETEPPNETDTLGPGLHGDLLDMGEEERVAVSFDYREADGDWRHVSLDRISADGEFFEEPDGYAHDGDYAHVNIVLSTGDSMAITYDEAGSDASFAPALRDGPYTADGSIDDIWSGSSKDVLPAGDTVEVRIEHGGEEVEFYVEDTLEWTADDIGFQDVYFSSEEVGGSTGEDSLRILRAEEVRELTGTFDHLVQVGEELDPSTEYEYRALANGVTGDAVTLETAEPVDTIAAENTDTLEPRFVGSVDLGTVKTATAWFQYKEVGEQEWNETETKTITESGEFEVSPQLAVNTDYEYRAVVDGVAGVTKSFEMDEPVETNVPLATDSMGPTFSGTISDLGGHDHADAWFEYRELGGDWTHVVFDKLSTDGDFHEGPDGYAHDGRYAHVNLPIVEGDSLTLEYYEAGSGADFQPFLRSSVYTADSSIDDIWEGTNRDVLPDDKRVEVEIVYEDGEVDIFVDGSLEWTATDLPGGEVYFSSYEFSGSSGTSSLRILESGSRTLDSPDTFENVLTVGPHLYPETEYEVRAMAEQIVGESVQFQTDMPVETATSHGTDTVGPEFEGTVALGGLNQAQLRFDFNETDGEDWRKTSEKTITESGSFNITQPLAETTTYTVRAIAPDYDLYADSIEVEMGDPVQTDPVTETDGLGPILRGDVNGLGGLETAAAWFEYREADAEKWNHVRFTHLSADGDFHEEPDGYAHDGRYIHVNTPILDGESITLFYNESGSGADLRPHLRAEEYSADGSIDDIWSGSNRDVFTPHGRTNLTIEHEGSEVRIYVDGEQQWTTTGIDRGMVYFSSYEFSGSSGSSSLRLLEPIELLESAEPFEYGIQVGQELESNTEYDVRAVTEAARGEIRTLTTGDPVETVEVTDADSFSPTFHGSLDDFGRLERVPVWFEYREDGDSDWLATDSDTITAEGAFDIPQQLTANTTYDLRAVAAGAPADTIQFETGVPVEALSPTEPDTVAPNIRGNVTNMGALDDVWVWFEYREADAASWRNFTIDDIEADGDFWDLPPGLAHDNDYIHLNRPIPDGGFVTLTYDEAGSGATLRPHLRDEEYSADGSIDDIWSGSNLDVLPSEGMAEIRIEHTGEEVDIYADGTKEWTATGIMADEVYFSSYEHAGTSGENSLRVVDSGELLEEDATFDHSVFVGGELDPETTYEYRLMAERTAGPVETFTTVTPFETVNASKTDTVGPVLYGDINLGNLDEGLVAFEYRKEGETEWQRTDSAAVDESAPFGITQPLESNATYQYRTTFKDAHSPTATFETGEPVDTLEATETSTLEPVLHGEVNDLGSLDEATVYFEYREQDTTEWHETSTETLTQEDTFSISEGLSSNTAYEFRAVAEESTGDIVEFQTGEPVETKLATGTDTFTPVLHGNVTDLGGEDGAAFFEYREGGETEWRNPGLEAVSADGSFWTDPDGYAHDNSYFHYNRPIHDGDAVSLRFNESGSGADFRPHLRDRPYSADGSIDDIWQGSQTSLDEYQDFVVRIEHVGDEVNIYVDDEREWTATGIEADEVYFSNYEHGGDSGENSLRVLGFGTYVDSETAFNRTLHVGYSLAPNTTYEYRAGFGGTTGEDVTFDVGSIIDDVTTTETDPLERHFESEVSELGDLPEVSVRFEYRDITEEDWLSTPVTNLSEATAFEETQAVKPNRTYEVRGIAGEAIGGSSTFETGDPVESLPATDLESIGPQFRGSIDDTGAFDDLAPVWFEYREQGQSEWRHAMPRHQFSTDGAFWADPHGYAHDNSYGHYNRPISPGETVVLRYHEADSGADFRPHLRDSPYEADGSIDDIWSGSNKDLLPSNEEFLVTIVHGGESVEVYLDGSHEWTAEDIDNEEIYFSAYEFSGSSGSTSLRLLGPGQTLAQPDEFSQPLQIGKELEADTTYEFRAMYDRAIAGTESFETTDPVETVAVTETQELTRQFTGNLTDLGGYDQLTVWFDYRERDASTWNTTATKTVTEPGTFNISQELKPDRRYEVRANVQNATGETVEFGTGDPVETLPATEAKTLGPTLHGNITDGGVLADNPPVWFEYREENTSQWQYALSRANLSADGDFWTDPDGYAHDDDYVHMNRPIAEGEVLVLLYDEAGSGADFEPHLRDSPYFADNNIDNIWDGSSKDVFEVDDVNPVQIRHFEDEVEIYVGDSREWTATGVTQDEVYFSGYEWSGTSGSNSLRLLGWTEGVAEAGPFNQTVQVGNLLEKNQTYEYRAIFENATGETVPFQTGDPVETLDATETETAGPTLHGNATLGGLEEVTVWFEYRPAGSEADWNQSETKTITDSGEFEIVQSLDSETSYEVRAVAEGVTGEDVVVETGDPVETKEPAALDTLTPEFRGDVTDLGGLETAAAWFEYRPADEQNWTHLGLEHVDADGDRFDDPAGWGHDGDWAHVNQPIDDGETMSVRYNASGSGANLTAALREGMQPANGSVGSFWESDAVALPSDTVEVTVAHDGEDVTIDVAGEQELVASDVTAETVYFSSGEVDGASGEDSLRLTGVGEVLADPGTFTNAPMLGILEPDESYEVRAVVEASTGSAVTFDSHVPEYHGSGTDTSPYHISNATELQFIGHPATEPTLANDFVVVEDIDVGATAEWYHGQGLEPVGDTVTSFTGTFDGNSHAISNLTIQRPDEEYVGLFGYVEGGESVIENLELDRVDVHGEEAVGGLVGRIDDGFIGNTSVAGDVAATYQRVGGMVGRTVDADMENRLVATGTVAGGEPDEVAGIGGLVGQSSGRSEISVAYTRSEVIGDNAGGIVGTTSTLDSQFEEMYSVSTVKGEDGGAIVGIIQDSGDEFADSVYWNTEIEEEPYGIEEESGWVGDWEGLVTEEMQGEAAEDNMTGFDWEETWVTVEVPEPGYPRFQWEAGDEVIISGTVTDGHDGSPLANVPVNATPDDDSDVTDGDGQYSLELFNDLTYELNATTEVDGFTVTNTTTTVPRAGQTVDFSLEPTYEGEGTGEEPYLIFDVEDLQQMRYDLAAHYELAADIDAAAATQWFEGSGFEPIGDDEDGFEGELAGAGHTISNLTIDRSGETDVGLFGALDGGTVRNLTLTELDVTGDTHVGGVVGTIEAGTVERVATTGAVAGSQAVGGLTGTVDTGGTVSQVNASVAVTGATAGGLAGNSTGTINQSHAHGTVTGGADVGGLVGVNDGIVNRTFATGETDGSSAGGLVAVNDGTVLESYWDENTTDQDTSDGGTALTTDELTGTSALATTALDFADTWEVTDDYPALRWQVPGADTGANVIVTVDNTTEPVVAEETMLVNATVENTGDETADQTIELLDFDHETVDDWTVELDAGETASHTFEWETTSEDAGSDEVTVLSQDHADDETVTVLGDANYTVSIVETTEPGAGDDLVVTANVTNEGEATPEQEITLAIDGSEEDTRELTVAAGETEQIDLVWETTDEDAGSHEANVSSRDDYDLETVTILEPADYQVDIEEAEDVPAGEDLTVSANVTNVGEAASEEEVTLTVEADQVDETTVSMPGGESESVVLTWETEEGDEGDHQATVATPDDTAEETLTVLEGSAFAVSILDASEEVVEGEDVTVNASVENTGDVEGTDTIELQDFENETADSQSVTLDSGETTTVELTWSTESGDEGTGDVIVASETDEAATEVTVLEAAGFTVAIDGTNEPVLEEESLTVDVTVQNTGDVEGTQSVELHDFDGGVVDAETLSLNSTETEQTTLTWETDVGDGNTDEITVESEDDTATETVTVEEQVSFAVDIVETEEVQAGETLAVTADITNTGEESGERDVTLVIEESPVDSHENLTLSSGETETIDLAWETYPGDAGDHQATVATPDDDDETTVTVTERPPLTACETLDQSGEYRLGANITDGTADTCFAVTASDVTLDGQGYHVDGSDGAGTAIAATDVTGLGVDNLTLVDWETGVSLDGAHSSTVTNASVATTSVGIDLFDANDVSIADVTVSVTGGESTVGIDFVAASDGSVEATTIENADDGIALLDSPGLTVANTSVSADEHGFLVEESDRFSITDSSVTDSAVGYRIADLDGPTLTGTSAADVTAGFEFVDVTNATVADISAIDTDEAGISVRGSLAAEDVTVGSTTASNATLSIDGQNVTVSGVTDPPENPDGVPIDRYFNASAVPDTDGSVLNVTLHYDDEDVADVDEDKLGLWHYDEEWHEIESTLDTSENELEATITQFSTFGAFQEPDPANLALEVHEVTDPTVAGEQFLADVEFENTGEAQADQQVTLEIDEEVVHAEGITVDGESSQNVTVTWNTTEEDIGNHIAVISSDDDWWWDGISVVEEGEEEELGNVTAEIVDTNAPITEGEVLDVTVNVTNVGEELESQDVTLHVEDLWLVDETNVTLEPGETEYVSLEWQTEQGDADEHNIAASSEVDADVDVVVVEPGSPPSYDVSITDVDEGESLALTAEIENTGDLDGDEETITLTHDGEAHDNTTVELEAGETETLTLEWTETFPADGVNDRVYVTSPHDSTWVDSTYHVSIEESTEDGVEGIEVVAEISNSDELAPLQDITLESGGSTYDLEERSIAAGDSETVTLQWEAFPDEGITDSLSVTSEDRSSSINGYYRVTFDEVTEGDDLVASVEVENTGDMTGGNQTIELEHDDVQKDSTPLVLGAGETETVTLVWEDYPDEGATDTLIARSEDNSDSRGSYFSVDILDIAQDDGLSMTAEVENTQDLRETQEVRLIYDSSLSTRSRVSTVYSSTKYDGVGVTLDPGESTQITLEWDDYPETGLRGPIFASSQNNYDFVRSNYRVDIVDFDEEDELVVTGDIWNTGTLHPEQDITLEYDGEVKDATELVVESGETEQVTLTWEDYPEEGIIDPRRVYLRSEDRSDSLDSRFRVSIDDVEDGDSVTVTSTISNTGDLEATQDIEMHYDDDLVDTQELTLAGGASTQVTHQWDYPDEGAVDPNRVYVSSEHDTDRIRPYFDVDVTDVVEAPGDALAVSADVENRGYPWSWGYSDPPIKTTQDIRLETDHEQVNQTTITLDGDETEEDIILTWEIEEGDVGGEQLWVKSDDTSSSIEVPEVIFEVEVTNTTAPITEGETLTVEAAIENTGYEETTQDLEMHMVEEEDDEEGLLVDTTNVTIGPRDTKTVSFEWDTAVGDAGNHFAAVSSEDRWDWDWTPVEPEEACRFPAGDAIQSSPTIVDGVIYVGSADGQLYALDAETCEELWSVETGAAIVSSPQVIHETVYVGSDTGEVLALATEDGSEEWTVETGDAVGSSPTFDDDIVYVGSNDGSLYAIDAETGEVAWTEAVGAPIASSPTVADETVYVGTGAGELVAIDTASESTDWSKPIGSEILSSPTVAGGTVFVGSDEGHLTARSTADGSEEWTAETGGAVDSSPAVVDDVVYVGSDDDHVYAMTVSTGETVWSFDAEAPVVSSPTVAGEKLFVGTGNDTSEAGHLFAIEAATGTEHWRFSTDGAVQSSPTVADGAVYFGTDAGVLSAIETHVVGWSADTRVEHRTLGHHGVGVDEGPVAAFGVTPPEPVEDEEVTFDASGSLGNIESYDWTSNATGFPEAGETVNHTFPGSGTYEVELTVTDDLGETDTATQTVEVREPGEFVVDIQETNEPVVANETLTVDAQVTNEDANAATQDVTLEIDDSVMDSSAVTLAGSDTTTVTLEWETDEGDADDYTAEVSSDDDVDSTPVTVLDPAAIALSVDDYGEEVEPETSATVTATVENLGDVTTTEQVTLLIEDDGQVDETAVELAGGETETVDLTWAGGDEGTYDGTVTAADATEDVTIDVIEHEEEETEEDDDIPVTPTPGDGEDEETEEDDPVPTNLTVENVTTPDVVAVGNLLGGTAYVTNEANASVNATVTFEVNTSSEVLDERTVSFEASETKAIPFETTVDHGDAPATNVTAETATDADWNVTTVAQNGSLDVTVRNDIAQPLTDAAIELEAVSLPGMAEPSAETSGTDENGTAAWSTLPAGEYAVTATAPDYRTVSEDISIAANETTTLELTLVPEPEPIQGEAHDEDGEPAPDVPVELIDEDEEEVIEETTTNETGQFTFESPAPASYSVSVGPEADQEIEIVTTGVLVANVTDPAGTPLASVPVEVMTRTAPSVADGTVPTWDLETDEEGMDSLSNLEAGTYVVNATLPNYERDSVTVETTPGTTTEATLVLAPEPGAIAGTVLAAENQTGLANATVELLEDGETVTTARTNATGGFVFEGLSVREYGLAIDHDGYEDESVESIGTEAGETVVVDAIELQAIDTEDISPEDPDEDESLVSSWWWLLALLVVGALLILFVLRRRRHREE